MHAPVCTIGPSLPTTNPAETPRMEPNICHSFSIGFIQKFNIHQEVKHFNLFLTLKREENTGCIRNESTQAKCCGNKNVEYD